MSFCSSCGTRSEESARFCSACGKPVAEQDGKTASVEITEIQGQVGSDRIGRSPTSMSCLWCGAEVQDGVKYCGQCARMSKWQPASPWALLAWAKRHLVAAWAKQHPLLTWAKRHPVALLVLLGFIWALYSDLTRSAYDKSVDDTVAIHAIQQRAVANAFVPMDGAWSSSPNINDCPLEWYNCAMVTYRVSILNGGDAKDVEAKWLVMVNKSNGKVGFIRTMSPLAKAGFLYPGLVNKEDVYATLEDLANDHSQK